MQKPTNQVAIETWMVSNIGPIKSDLHGSHRPIRKIAVRVRKGLPGAGQFNGATNFRGTLLP